MTRLLAADCIGWLATAVSLFGHGMAAHGIAAGWIFRACSGPPWLATALLTGRPPYVAIAVAYLAIDSYGAWKRLPR